MARKSKHQGLQKKFEDWLSELLQPSKSLSTAEIIDALSQDSAKAMSDEEKEDLKTNFANYAKRAKDSQVIDSVGSWGGYRLKRQFLTPEDVGTATKANSKKIRRGRVKNTQITAGSHFCICH